MAVFLYMGTNDENKAPIRFKDIFKSSTCGKRFEFLQINIANGVHVHTHIDADYLHCTCSLRLGDSFLQKPIVFRQAEN